MVAPKKNSYSDLFDETLGLWELYAKKYCSLLEDYYDALEAKNTNWIRGEKYRVIKKTELYSFPVITLFCIEDEDDAIEYMLNLPEDRLKFVNKQIYKFLDSKLYKDLQAKTFDFNHAVRMKKAGRSLYSVSPDSCGSGKHHSKHLGPDYDK